MQRIYICNISIYIVIYRQKIYFINKIIFYSNY